jgi:predicted DNA-binding mobile mystery protein A
MDISKIAIKQIDNQLNKWKFAKIFCVPKYGWIKVIRTALGMTTTQLARKLNVDRSRIIRIEADEIKTALTMKTLITVADALNCDFVYALVPRKPLCKIIEQQANKIAMLQLDKISHNMFLENQMVTPEKNKKQLKELKTRLLEEMPKNFWDNND